jgi:hypothetical protein
VVKISQDKQDENIFFICYSSDRTYFLEGKELKIMAIF